MNDRIVREMQLTQIRLEQFPELPWFLQSLETVAKPAGGTAVSLPTGFLREVESGENDESAMWYLNADGYPIPIGKRDFGNARSYLPNTSGSGVPSFYSAVGPNIHVFPQSDVAYTLQFLIYKADAVLSTNIENQWLIHAPDLLIAETCKIMGKHLQYPVDFSDDVQEARQRLTTATVAREEANRSRTLGG
jgi:hypothetical protein